MKSETILVTGGAGYIGSITVKNLIDAGYDVVILDSLENGHREAIDSRAKLEIANLGKIEEIRAIFAKYHFDAVIDFAAYLMVGESMTQPKSYMNNNVANFINLLDVMSQSGRTKLIKSSTAAVYGSPSNESDFPLSEDYVWTFKPTQSSLLNGEYDNDGMSGEDFFQKIISYYDEMIANRSELKLSDDELTSLRIPTNVYGLTKLLDEILMKKYEKIAGIKSIVLRYFNVAGADTSGEIGEDHPVETHLIPRLIKNITKNEEFQLFGTDYQTKDGTAVRDYIHVTDLALGHIEALKYLLEENISNTFNLGSSDGYTTLEILDAVEKVTGGKINRIDAPRRPGDPAKLLANPEKAKKVLKWETKRDIYDMIETAYKWHEAHPNGYERVIK